MKAKIHLTKVRMTFYYHASFDITFSPLNLLDQYELILAGMAIQDLVFYKFQSFCLFTTYCQIRLTSLLQFTWKLTF
jgi:hypothetical protein